MSGFPVSIQPDFWSILAIIASTAVAIFTAVLAISTWRLADRTASMAAATSELVQQNILASELADRHHQESLTPLLVADAALRSNTIVRHGFTGYEAHLEGTISNCGPGPAQKVTVTVTPQTTSTTLPAAFVGMVGPNSQRSIFGISWPLPDGGYAYSNEQPVPFKVIITYESIFGAAGSLSYASHSGRAEDLQLVSDPVLPSYTPRNLSAGTARAE